ncbi:sensor domain-containing diguanylate cyclase [Halomonas nitroreducens]|nr:sensor domain-containing diguanylate cyclase [Halomonas nitroreducens]
MIPTHDGADLAGRREFEASLITAIHEASPDGILVVDDQSRIVSHNQRLFEVFDIDPAAITGTDDDGDLAGLPERRLMALALQRILEPAEFLSRVEELYADPALEDHCEIELVDGRTLERHSKALRGPHGRHLGRVWFFRDITERKEVEHRLEALSRRDPLTGVANLRYFFERAADEYARVRRSGGDCSLLMLDLDHFKRINDHWGHATGDEVLKAFCDTVRDSLREVDLLGRLGGEEFAVLLPDTDREGAARVAERLRRRVEQHPVPQDSQVIPYTVSCGVATLRPDDDSAEAVLRRADDALYRAKAAGRNHSVGEPPREAILSAGGG